MSVQDRQTDGWVVIFKRRVVASITHCVCRSVGLSVALSVTFGASFAVEVGLKKILEPSYVVNYFWFWKYSPIFLG